MTFFEKCSQRTEHLFVFSKDVNQTYMVIVALRDTLKKHRKIINTSPNFYNSIFRSCMQSIFVDLSKIYYEKDFKNTESTLNFLNKLKNNLGQLNNNPISVNLATHIEINKGNFTEKKFINLNEMIDYFLEQIKNYKSSITAVHNLRNKYFAHLDLSSLNDLDKLFKENGVSLNTVEELLNLNANICVALYKFFKGIDAYPLALNHNDYFNTVQLLK